MNLKILLPFQVFAQLNNILSVVAQTPHGSFGLLPQRLDCVTSLSPGILTYVTAAGDNYVAVDEGVLIKTGSDVLISVRHAIGGSDLGQLRAAVENEFLKLDEQQTSVRTMLAKLESSFIARFVKYNHG
jgi:F-type H+-transporting ATPase subunit epsilon